MSQFSRAEAHHANHHRRTHRPPFISGRCVPHPDAEVVVEGDGVPLEGDLVRHVQAAAGVNEKGSADLLQRQTGNNKKMGGMTTGDRSRQTRCSLDVRQDVETEDKHLGTKTSFRPPPPRTKVSTERQNALAHVLPRNNWPWCCNTWCPTSSQEREGGYRSFGPSDG